MSILNRIGVFTFDTMSARWRGAQEQVEVIQRPGTNGSGMFLMGRKGQPVVVRTGVCVLNRARALSLYGDYEAYVSAAPLTINWGGVALTAWNLNYGVLRVELVEARALAKSVGGDYAGGLGWLSATWHLLPLNIT